MAIHFPPLSSFSPQGQWSALLVLSVALSALLMAFKLPAALFLGPMIAGVVIGVNSGSIRIPTRPHFAAQAIIGCMIARSISPTIVQEFFQQWYLFLGLSFLLVLSASLLGWIIARCGIIPGTTAIWGLSPGAASVMMLMAGAFGADMQLVAFMQYLRVLAVAAGASVVAHFWFGYSGASAGHLVWFPPINWLPFAQTLAVALIGGLGGRLSRMPAGALLVPMVAGAVLQGTGIIKIELPLWLLAISYAIIGWSIGLGFTARILSDAMRALPQTVLAITALIVFSGGIAFALFKLEGIDPLTAYLATSPGGLDSIAIIGASSKVDLEFVMTFQTMRFVMVLAVGPFLSRLVAGTIATNTTTPVLTATESQTLQTRVTDDEGDLD